MIAILVGFLTQFTVGQNDQYSSRYGLLKLLFCSLTQFERHCMFEGLVVDRLCKGIYIKWIGHNCF